MNPIPPDSRPSFLLVNRYARQALAANVARLSTVYEFMSLVSLVLETLHRYDLFSIQ